MLEERQAQIGDRTQGVTGYIGNTSALRMKKSPSMEVETQGTALREENVADLIAERNEHWGDINENVASHGTVE